MSRKPGKLAEYTNNHRVRLEADAAYAEQA